MHSGLLLPMELKYSPGLSSQLSPFSPLRTPGSGTWQHLSSGGRHLRVVQSSRRTSLCGFCSHALLDQSLALEMSSNLSQDRMPGSTPKSIPFIYTLWGMAFSRVYGYSDSYGAIQDLLQV